MRTDRVLVPQSMSLIAWMMFLRAWGLVVRRHRVLEIEEHDVGGRLRRLLEHLRLAEPGTASSLAVQPRRRLRRS